MEFAENYKLEEKIKNILNNYNVRKKGVWNSLIIFPTAVFSVSRTVLKFHYEGINRLINYMKFTQHIISSNFASSNIASELLVCEILTEK
jgi:hypothetical protein